jgi:hypothetical protein
MTSVGPESSSRACALSFCSLSDSGFASGEETALSALSDIFRSFFSLQFSQVFSIAPAK